MELKKRPKWALLIIDMENAFVDPSSPHCIKMASGSLPAFVPIRPEEWIN
jgi:hypothetical protein